MLGLPSFHDVVGTTEKHDSRKLLYLENKKTGSLLKSKFCFPKVRTGGFVL